MPRLPEEIRTARLLLRCPQPGEEAAVNAAIRASFARLHPWMPWCAAPPTLEESATHTRETHERFQADRDYGFRIWSRDGATCLGSTGLHPRDAQVPSFEIGYWLADGAEGRGYASEAVRALARTAFAQLDARRVEIRADVRNRRSWAVAERCGFVREGVLRNATADHTGLRDMAVYAILAVEELR